MEQSIIVPLALYALSKRDQLEKQQIQLVGNEAVG
jgi:hypothetical protein